MQRVVMNLGIGIGGVVGGFIATESFRALFLLDALTFVAYAAVLTVFVHEPVHKETRAERSGSYGTVFRHRIFMALMVMNALYISAGIAQLEILPAFAKNEAGVSEQGIGWLFFVNTLVVVRAAAADDARARGKAAHAGPRRWSASSPRSPGCSCPASSLWLAGASAFAVLALAVSVFAVAECLHGAVQAPLVVDLADPRLIGRYMAISALSWQVGFTIGPAVGGALLAASPTGLWVVMAFVMLATGAATLTLERGLPEGLRRSPRGAHAQEPVPLPVVATRARKSRRRGVDFRPMPTLEDPLSTYAQPAPHPADAVGLRRGPGAR